MGSRHGSSRHEPGLLPNKALELTGRRWVGLPGAPAGGRPVRGRLGGRPPVGAWYLHGGRQLNAWSVRQQKMHGLESASLSEREARGVRRLRRAILLCKALIVASGVFWAVGLVRIQYGYEDPVPDWLWYALGPLGFITIAWGTVTAFLPCPRCSAPFVAFQLVRFHVSPKTKCFHCNLPLARPPAA
jgi:hypothetical protein